MGEVMFTVDRDDENGPTLNHVLDELGYERQHIGALGSGRKTVLKDGEVVCSGFAYEVWDWLETTGQIEFVGSVECERCGKSVDDESAGSVHDYIAGGRITVCDPCMDAEPSGTHDDENCSLILGAPCAHPDCAWQSRSKEG